MMSFAHRVLGEDDSTQVLRRGLRVMLAIERFHAATGDYPAQLADLAPRFLDPMPLDPWSGKPYGYIRVDPKQDRLGRSYLVYSVGSDRTDDGGKSLTREEIKKIPASQRAYEHGDDVINQPSARDER